LERITLQFYFSSTLILWFTKSLVEELSAINDLDSSSLKAPRLVVWFVCGMVLSVLLAKQERRMMVRKLNL